MSVIRVLCLFSSAPLRAASFFARREAAWATETEHGRFEFVPLVVDGEMETLATSGLFAAATLLCRRADLSPSVVETMRAGALSFARAAVPLELVPAEGRASVVDWLASKAPELALLCAADGEVRTESPSWWEDRARRQLSREDGASGR
jgi:hypothetical protein